MVCDYLLLPSIMTVTVSHTASCHTAQFKSGDHHKLLKHRNIANGITQ